MRNNLDGDVSFNKFAKMFDILLYRVFHNCWNKAAASKTFIDDLIHFSLSRLS